MIPVLYSPNDPVYFLDFFYLYADPDPKRWFTYTYMRLHMKIISAEGVKHDIHEV